MSKSKSSRGKEQRIHRVNSEVKTRLDKYKHLVYDEDVYDSDEFVESLTAKSKIYSKQEPK
jgi:hypothetical protein